MVLVFKFLEEVKDVNTFVEVDRRKVIKGNSTTLYFRLLQDKSEIEDHLPHLRYIPQSGASISVKFDHIDSEKVLTRTAVLAFPSDDRSVWKVELLSTDLNIAFNSMSVSLAEGTNIQSILPHSDLIIVDPGDGRLYC
jgi:hypothetical protein